MIISNIAPTRNHVGSRPCLLNGKAPTEQGGKLMEIVSFALEHADDDWGRLDGDALSV